LPGVEGLEDILETELYTSVDNNTDSRGSNTVVEGSNTVLLNSLHKTVSDTVVHLDLTDISSEGSTDVDEGVDDGVGDGTSEGSRSDLSQSKHTEIGVLVVDGEHSLKGILEHQVAGSSGHITDAVGNVTSPERRSTDLSDVTFETISHTVVACHFT